MSERNSIKVMAAAKSEISPVVNDLKVPTLNWVKRNLRRSVIAFYGEVVAAYVVGSVARGTAREDSDLDIAVIVRPQRGAVSSLKFTERYHARILHESWKPIFKDRRIDFQFFYESDTALENYSKIKLG